MVIKTQIWIYDDFIYIWLLIVFGNVHTFPDICSMKLEKIGFRRILEILTALYLILTHI